MTHADTKLLKLPNNAHAGAEIPAHWQSKRKSKCYCIYLHRFRTIINRATTSNQVYCGSPHNNCDEKLSDSPYLPKLHTLLLPANCFNNQNNIFTFKSLQPYQSSKNFKS